MNGLHKILSAPSAELQCVLTLPLAMWFPLPPFLECLLHLWTSLLLTEVTDEPVAVARATAPPLTIDREATEATDEPVAVARASAPPLTLGREATEATDEPVAVALAPAPPLTIDREVTEAMDEPAAVAVARAPAPPLTLGREATEATDEPAAVAVARATTQPLTIGHEGTELPVAVAPASPSLGDAPGSAGRLKRLRQPVRQPPGIVVAQAPLGNNGAPAGDRASLEVSDHSSVIAAPEVKRVGLVVDLEQDDAAGPAPAVFRPPQCQDVALLPLHSCPLTNVPNVVEDDLSGSSSNDMLQVFIRPTRQMLFQNFRD
jgi:hypothetical protein